MAAATSAMDLDDVRLKLLIGMELRGLGIKLQKPSKDVIKAKKRAARASSANDLHAAKVFGVNVEEVTSRTGVESEEDGLMVPRALREFVEAIRSNLHVEGLFRINGSAARMKRLQADIDSGKTATGVLHDLTGLLKQFFRMMPEPLFTFRLYDSFVAAFQLGDEEERKLAVLLLCALLPKANLHVLAYIMRLLHDIQQNADKNKMEASSLAQILCPNLIRPPQATPITSQQELADHASCVGVIELLILHAGEVGNIPVPLIISAQKLTDMKKAEKRYEKLMQGRAISLFKRNAGTIRMRNHDSVSRKTLNLLKASAQAASHPGGTHPRHRDRTSSISGAQGPIAYDSLLPRASSSEPQSPFKQQLSRRERKQLKAQAKEQQKQEEKEKKRQAKIERQRQKSSRRERTSSRSAVHPSDSSS